MSRQAGLSVSVCLHVGEEADSGCAALPTGVARENVSRSWALLPSLTLLLNGQHSLVFKRLYATRTQHPPARAVKGINFPGSDVYVTGFEVCLQGVLEALAGSSKFAVAFLQLAIQ